jgi:uncharacterized protein
MNKQEAITRLQLHKSDLKKLGIKHVALFGSSARGEETDRSDVDLAVRLDGRRKLGLLRLIEIERQIGAMLGAPVDLVTEPVSAPRLQHQIDRDRIDVF